MIKSRLGLSVYGYPDKLILFLRFSRQTLYPKDISRISLMGRGRFYSNRGDAIVIETIGGDSFVLADQLCRNIREIKMALLADYSKYIVDAPAQKRPVSRPAADEPEEFSGNHVLSLNGVFLYGLVAGFTFLGIHLYSLSHSPAYLIILIPLIVFVFAFGAQLFYFRLEGDTLVIKNHIFRWYNKEYLLPDIDSVVFERIGKQSNALRIRTIDFRSRSFSAGSLRDRRWVEFAAALEKRGIPVRNELAGIGLPLTRDQ